MKMASVSLIMLFAALVSMNQVEALDIGLPSGCFDFKVNKLVQTFYIHFIRSSTNTSVPVNEVPVSGLASQQPPYSFSYTFVFSRKLTVGPSYTSQELGRLEGYSSITSPGVEFSQADFFFNSNTTRTGYYAIQGDWSPGQGAQKVPVTGGVEGYYYALGEVDFDAGTPSGGNNLVIPATATLYLLSLC